MYKHTYLQALIGDKYISMCEVLKNKFLKTPTLSWQYLVRKCYRFFLLRKSDKPGPNFIIIQSGLSLIQDISGKIYTFQTN